MVLVNPVLLPEIDDENRDNIGASAGFLVDEAPADAPDEVTFQDLVLGPPLVYSPGQVAQGPTSASFQYVSSNIKRPGNGLSKNFGK